MNDSSLLMRGLWLEYLTLGWNVVGAIVVAVAALSTGSIALAGFGIDSAIEIFASLVVIWELRGTGRGREKRALSFIGFAFFALVAYVLIQSAGTLIAQTRPATSPLGIAWLAATLIAMLSLAYGKHRTGVALGNPVLKTEARVTLVDAVLAAAVLVGLILNAIFGWWWADPLAGLVIVYYGAREGWHALKESGIIR